MRNHTVPSLHENIPISRRDILKSMSDDKSLVLLNTVALLDPESRGLKRKVQFTRRQYYSRIHNFTRYGLIRLLHGKYYLTSLGKVVYDIELKIGRAVNNFLQLKALDCIEETNEVAFNDRESYTNVVNSLIKDAKIKEFLLTVHSNSQDSWND